MTSTPETEKLSGEELSNLEAHADYARIYERDLTEVSAADLKSLVTELRALRKAKHIGWFTTTANGTLVYLEGTRDPREVHDNGKPYHKALIVPTPPSNGEGGA